MDPRVARTRTQVFDAVRCLLETQEPLTFSTVSAQSGVSRKTLYSHWSSMAQLISELLATHHEQALPEPSGDKYADLHTFLHEIQDAFDDQATRAAMSHLLGDAPIDPAATAALQQLTAARAKQLGALLGTPVSAAQLARLVGPIFFLRFVAGRRVSATMLADLAHAGIELLDVGGSLPQSEGPSASYD